MVLEAETLVFTGTPLKLASALKITGARGAKRSKPSRAERIIEPPIFQHCYHSLRLRINPTRQNKATFRIADFDYYYWIVPDEITG